MRSYLDACFAAGSAPHVSELAQRLKISRFVLTRAFASARGIPLSSYLRRAQVIKAKSLLRRHRTLSLTDVAHACGFEHPRSFFRAFRRQTGMSPAEYRARTVPRRT